MAKADFLEAQKLKLNSRLQEAERLIRSEATVESLRQSKTLQIRRIKTAIQTIEKTPRAYGYCARCEEPVPRKRLIAIPEATHCLECQERMEVSIKDRLNFAEAAVSAALSIEVLEEARVATEC